MRRVTVQKLSILIPVYNEIRTLKRLLEQVLEAPLPCERELIVVDDGSTDGSRELLTEFAAREPRIRIFFHRRNGGKGKAIRTAIRQMTGDWAIIQDADLEYDPRDYQKLLVPVLDGVADVVFGSRFLTGRYRRAMYYWHTKVNNLLTGMCNLLTDLNLTDMETCYKLIRADILQSLVLRSRGFDLEPELTIKLAKWGARIYEVPISYRGRTYAEGKKIGARDAIAAFTAMVRYKFFDVEYTTHDGFIILQAVRRAKRFNRWLFDQFGDELGDEVLEAGCGIGNLTELILNRRRVVCIDYEDFYVDRLQEAYGHLANIQFMQGDLTKPEDLARAAEDGKFDGIFCINVLEHIEPDVQVLRNFFEVLKPGGQIVILVPHDPTNYTEVDRTLGHFRRYTFDELAGKLGEAGFEVRSVKGFNRVGGLGWRFSGKVLKKKTLTPGQMTLFEWGLPAIRLAEKVPFHSHNSVIAIGRRPAAVAEDNGETRPEPEAAAAGAAGAP